MSNRRVAQAGLVWLALTLLTGQRCLPGPDGDGPEPTDLPEIRNAELRSVNDWAYQLQGDPVLDLGPIADSAFDLVVIDYSADGGGGR